MSWHCTPEVPPTYLRCLGTSVSHPLWNFKSLEKFLESVIEEHMAAREKPASGDDLYSRVDYRRFVAWPKRIRREAPFLMEVLEKAPTRSVIDLGCGTGEHCRFLAGEGFEAVGLDRSASMLANAQELITRAPQLAIYPGLMIFVTVIAFNFLGDGLQDALDPRASRR